MFPLIDQRGDETETIILGLASLHHRSVIVGQTTEFEQSWCDPLSASSWRESAEQIVDGVGVTFGSRQQIDIDFDRRRALMIDVGCIRFVSEKRQSCFDFDSQLSLEERGARCIKRLEGFFGIKLKSLVEI